MLKDIAGKVKHYLTMENTLFTHGWGKKRIVGTLQGLFWKLCNWLQMSCNPH